MISGALLNKEKSEKKKTRKNSNFSLGLWRVCSVSLGHGFPCNFPVLWVCKVLDIQGLLSVGAVQGIWHPSCWNPLPLLILDMSQWNTFCKDRFSHVFILYIGAFTLTIVLLRGSGSSSDPWAKCHCLDANFLRSQLAQGQRLEPSSLHTVRTRLHLLCKAMGACSQGWDGRIVLSY